MEWAGRAGWLSVCFLLPPPPRADADASLRRTQWAKGALSFPRRKKNGALDMKTNVSQGLWDMTLMPGKTLDDPDNPYMWSQDFRKMLLFKDTTDFPNVLNSWADRLHPDHKKLTLEAARKCWADVTGATVYDVEYLLQDKEGEYRWFRASGQVERNPDGTPIRIVGMFIDIDDQRKASGDNEFKDYAKL